VQGWLPAGGLAAPARDGSPALSLHRRRQQADWRGCDQRRDSCGPPSPGPFRHPTRTDQDL